MLKAIPKILIIIFLLVFILQLASLIFLLAVPEPSQAVDPLELQVKIGDTKKITFDKTTAPIAEYIKAIYKYAIGIVGILAAVVLMFGGVLWLTAGGNTERVTNAKSWIGASLTGLVLALCSYMILATINPGLVDFRVKPVGMVDEHNTSGWYFSWHNTITQEKGNSKFYKTLAECKTGEKKDTHIHVTISMPCRNDSVAMFNYSWACIPQGKSCLSTLGSGWLTAPTLYTKYCIEDKICSGDTQKTCCRRKK
ncbi:MAG: pilin [Patescibacteria group bacterium]|nr:pilin [Patescibacteria group bacterium]